MSYIQNNLQAGEEIKYKADIHWYIFAYPVILLLLSAFFSSAQTGLFYYVSIFLLLSGLFQLIKKEKKKEKNCKKCLRSKKLCYNRYNLLEMR